MSQNESTTFLVTDAKNLTLIDANRENSPWCFWNIFDFSLSYLQYISGIYLEYLKQIPEQFKVYPGIKKEYLLHKAGLHDVYLRHI